MVDGCPDHVMKSANKEEEDKEVNKILDVKMKHFHIRQAFNVPIMQVRCIPSHVSFPFLI